MMKQTSLILLTALAISCAKPDKETLFRKVDVREHGIDFANTITENDSLNILTLEYIYNGGGVAVADFNNDGLSDLFFTGNMVANKLYLNQGELNFKDVSAEAGIGAPEKWKSGVAIADINNDGLKDIYVCATIKKDSALRKNMLFINKGLNTEGIPVFEDQATAFGVDYAGHSSGAAFIDYDNDNDLDLYIITNSMLRGVPTSYRPKMDNGTVNSDILLRNNGDNTFTNVSKEAGIVHEGYGLGLAIADINKDGWQDIYVSNDYITNDLLYINNHDGTFSNDIDKCIKHQSMFSMGNDVADFNNDALPDIITLDMLPEGNLRKKTVIGGASYSSYLNNQRYGYAHQYVRNVVQLNNGDGTFSEVGQLAGVHQTEWSWSPLFIDLDNDGFRDLLVTNGFPRDITDKDFASFRAETRTIASVRDQMDSIPIVKISNYAFQNSGDLVFKDVTKLWGLDDRAFSNGAAFADLDNDGDVEYIVNNINDNILLYENTLYNRGKEKKNHFMRIRLQGPKGNPSGFGAKVSIYYDSGKVQYHDHSVSRGYISSVEDVIHFGTGDATSLDSLTVIWPDGKESKLLGTKGDQVLEILYTDASASPNRHPSKEETLYAADAIKLQYVHDEEDKIDFNLQRTLPHKFSQRGPSLAVGDVNGDGRDDVYIGGSEHNDGNIFLQNSTGGFQKTVLIKPGEKKQEDQGALFFDIDNDRDLDLYVVSGSFEPGMDSVIQQDRLYINNGKGKFTLDDLRLSATASNGSCVRAGDFDGDGDLDLFVGGSVKPGEYPFSDKSYLFENVDGVLKDQTSTFAPALAAIGIVNDALWTDVDNDNKIDLVLAREFMPLAVLKNSGKKLTLLENTGLENFSGWWNSLAAGDFDSDGDTDYVAGNLGNNNYYKASEETPLRVYAKDFDGNGSVDAVLSCYLLSENGERKEFPVHFWEELNSQSPKFRRQFKYYKKFGVATLDKILSEEDRKGALILTATWMSTSFIENLGGGKFSVRALPVRVQTAPVNGIVSVDANQDGHLDLVLVGNDYGNEVNIGRYDAFEGGVLLNNGQGKFEYATNNKSGFKVKNDAKSLVSLRVGDRDAIFASQNRDSLKVFLANKGENTFVFVPKADDVWGEVEDANRRKRKIEFYYGNGYLSQSGRAVRLDNSIRSLVIHNARGETRTVQKGNPESAAVSIR